MSKHADRSVRRHRRKPFDSVRVRAFLCLGLLAAPFVTGTYAYWTDDVIVQGTTLTSGTLDINVGGGDPKSTTTLSMSAMVPGSSSAEVLAVNNVGDVPVKYTMTGGLTGTGATEFSAVGSSGLLLTILVGGTVSGSGQSATCTGGTAAVTNQPLTTNTSSSILGKRPTSPLAATSGSESLCFQITLSATAPSSLQGKTASATFTVTGTSDVS